MGVQCHGSLNHVYGTKGITLWDHLEALYEKYGRRLFKQGYFVIDASVDTNVVFDGLRCCRYQQ